MTIALPPEPGLPPTVDTPMSLASTASGGAMLPATGDGEVVLIVDDVPDNLALLHDALDESGYTVLVATSGQAALARAAQALPDVVLLDAVMPGMDGFEVARRLKAQPATVHIPILFMTGLTDTEYLVAALQSGGVDYVTKPIKPREVLARMAVHLGAARAARQQARELLLRYCGTAAPVTPPVVVDWLRRHLATAQAHIEPPRLTVEQGASRLTFRLHRQTGDEGGGGDWLIVMSEEDDASVIDAMASAFGLTAREAEVLYWVVKGKINRDIGEILGASPATVKKHLERVFAKLGVETRTAAAAMALRRIRLLQPRFEG